MENTKIGVMLDMSRNAVMKVDKVKEYVGILKSFGYDFFMLYLEDTFEVSDEPLFGYLRGGYTKAELKEIDVFCDSIGVELIPCVQTLAHLNQIFRWQEYRNINDVNDILLAQDERTYKLIENIFLTLKECFKSRTVLIGMDEAQLVGRGNFLDKFGYKDKFDILLSHLNRVSGIAEKYGFKSLMWSDMFFNRSSDGGSYGDKSVGREIADKIPENVNLVAWDYYHTEKSFYGDFLDRHLSLDKNVWFACSAYASRGFAPNNNFSLKEISASVSACKEKKIQNILACVWGGNGAECSYFSVLPALFYLSETVKGIDDLNQIKSDFNKITGENFDNFLLLDLPNDIFSSGLNYGPSKYMLYNDPLSGIFDYTVKGGENLIYKSYAEKLSEISDTKYKYIFETLSSLCSVLSVKYELGVKTRTAYQNKDIKALKNLVKEYGKCIKLLGVFYKKFKTAWFTDNKPHGFDVQDIRIGGLEKRLYSARDRIIDFVNGKIKDIPELDEKIINVDNGKKESGAGVVVFNDYKTNATVNIL